LLKRAYFANPDNKPGIFSGGGHSAQITLFSRKPEEKTGLGLGLFSCTGDEIPAREDIPASLPEQRSVPVHLYLNTRKVTA
jgi:hypothetical protein